MICSNIIVTEIDFFNYLHLFFFRLFFFIIFFFFLLLSSTSYLISIFSVINFLEFLWSLIPFLLIFFMISPVLLSLYELDYIKLSSCVLEIIGNQWYWSYVFQMEDWILLHNGSEIEMQSMYRGSSNFNSIYELSSYSYHSTGNPLMIFHNDIINIKGALYFDQSLLFSYDYSNLFLLQDSIFLTLSVTKIPRAGIENWGPFNPTPLRPSIINPSIIYLSSINDFISIFDSKPIIISSYLISVDHFLILPLYESLKSYITSIDVIHSWGIYSLGCKIDAIPGRLNLAFTLRLFWQGEHRGFCYELCGQGHYGMQIIALLITFWL